MNKRAYRVFNFFAFNLLFFALYLNFIHKDKSAQEAFQNTRIHSKATVLVKSAAQDKQALYSLDKNTTHSAKEVVSTH